MNEDQSVRESFFGIAMRRPAASGRGNCECAAFIRASERMIAAGNGATFFAFMSTCNVMFSEVAETHPSVA